MEIILLERVRNLGKLGDKVRVKNGYARNYLVPHGKAVAATQSNVAMFEQRRAELEKAAAESLAAASKRAEKFQDLVLTFVRRTKGEDGKLYGSIGIQDIFDSMVEKNLEIDKREIHLPKGVIRMVGEHEAEVLLHSEVIVTVKVIVEVEA